MRTMPNPAAAALLVAAGLLAALAASIPAEARERVSSGTVTGPRGGVSSYGGTATRTPGQGSSINRSATGPNGQTATRSRGVTNNGDGTFSTGATTTGPRGQSVNRSGTTSVTR